MFSHLRCQRDGEGVGVGAGRKILGCRNREGKRRVGQDVRTVAGRTDREAVAPIGVVGVGAGIGDVVVERVGAVLKDGLRQRVVGAGKRPGVGAVGFRAFVLRRVGSGGGGRGIG